MRRIAIIGAGLSGSLVATALARSGADGLAIDLIDARGTFGYGLAYTPRDPQHVLNVPAQRASVRADEPGHFTAFAQSMDPRVGAGDYVQRAWFGEYVHAELEGASAQLRSGSLECIAAEVTAVRAGEDAQIEVVEFADGSVREYDDVVLALGNLPGGARIATPIHAGAFASPWAPGALSLDDVSPEQPYEVLVIGTALTAIDAVLSLTARHESIRVTAVSRSGRMPFTQLPGGLREAYAPPQWAGESMPLDELVERVRAHVAAGEDAGFDWRDVVDGIRRVVPKLWRALSVEDQAQFIARYDRDWELRRHRVAPQVMSRLDQLRYDDRFEVYSGGVHDIVVEHHKLVATLAPERELPTRREFDRVIDCTGAATDIVRTTSELVLQLLHDGRVLADPHRRGLRTTSDGVLLDAAERPSERLHTLGVLRRGELWETTGIAEIRDQAYALAQRLAAVRA